MYNVVGCTPEQVNKLWTKHLKPFNRYIGKITSTDIAFDYEDDIIFITLNTITGKTFQYKIRENKPMFIECTGFGNTRYDISYPEQHCKELYLYLQQKGIELTKEFLKGSRI